MGAAGVAGAFQPGAYERTGARRARPFQGGSALLTATALMSTADDRLLLLTSILVIVATVAALALPGALLGP